MLEEDNCLISTSGFPHSWKILEKKWSWKVMEKSWKIAKLQNFMEICLPGKKVMEISCPNPPSWKVMEKSWNFVFEFVWKPCRISYHV